ncbi:hypothetical protein L7F22_045553 [Adiantum nelumboides]|nr:hypothetical protein [Adiantum nelumboides]
MENAIDAAAAVRVTVAVALLAMAVAHAASMGVEGASGYREDASSSLPGSFIALQNKARAEVGVPPLKWSPRLASYAQWWANQNAAFGGCGLHHSKGPYGENIFWGSGKNWIPGDAVRDWADEKRWYDYRSNSCDYYDACGHYTQIVWKSSRFVGCARVTCDNGRIFTTCNYFPPGNFLGQRPY